jgi:predicted dehydrogenase
VAVRLIQVGLGQWGRSWAKSVLSGSTDVEVVAWVDPGAEARELARELVGAPADRFHSTLDDALAATDADAVLGTLAIHAHAPVALAALRAGKHVLLEKPFAPTLSEAAEVVAEAEKRDLVLTIAQNYRFFPSMRAMAELVGDGALGQVNRVRVDFRRYHPGRGPRPLDHELLTPLAIHHFDLMRAVLGQEPTQVSCRLWSPPWSSSLAPVSASAVIEFDGGAVVTYSGSRMSTGPQTPWEGEWHLECERGELTWARDGGPGIGSVGDHIEVRARDEPTRLVAVPALPVSERAALLAGFVAAVRDGGQPPSPGHDNIRSLALLAAARESAATGRAVPMTVAEL